jgi:hypothetical protein
VTPAARPAPAPAAWDDCARWARSGVMALAGPAGGPPAPPPAGFVGRLDELVAEIEMRLAERGHLVRLSWPAALAGRAAVLGLRRQGRISPNGSCRLLRAADGWVALNLARQDDVELIPALTGGGGAEPWQEAAGAAAATRADEFVARARLLGLASARLAETTAPPWSHPYCSVERWGEGSGAAKGSWRVVDLSAMWAGPVAARVLAEAGASVVKVESLARPDGARATPGFYRWIHPPGEVTVGVDLSTGAGRRKTAELIDGADVVIEGSRPRALEQLGLGPDDRPGRPDRVWLSITGYGRSEAGGHWVAFGDDAAVAGGLVGRDEAGDPVFLGDAIADPLTGLVGALAVLRAIDAGGGRLIDVALSRVAAALVAGGGPVPGGPGGVTAGAGGAPSGVGGARAGAGGAPGGVGGATAGPGGLGGAPEGPGCEPGGPGRAVVVEGDGGGGWRVRAGDRSEPVREGPEDLEWVSSR